MRCKTYCKIYDLPLIRQLHEKTEIPVGVLAILMTLEDENGDGEVVRRLLAGGSPGWEERLWRDIWGGEDWRK